jgi:hypothetical protein
MIVIPSGLELPNNPLIGYHNLVTVSNISSDEAASQQPVTQLANPSTYNPWAGQTTSQQAVTLSLNAAASVDYFGIARHNFGSAAISYTIQYSDDSAAWLNADAETVPDDDGVILHHFISASHQYWRLLMEAGTEPPSIAALYIGQILQLPRRIYVGHTPADYGRKLTLSTGRSESGQFLGRVVRKRVYKTSIDIQNLDPAWYRTNFEPFVEVAEENPFFWGWRPQDYDEEAAFVWSTSDIVPVNQRSNGMMEVKFPVEGLIA